MSATSDEAMRLLREIHAMLREMKWTNAPAQAATLASDYELDGPYGNPFIRAKDPKDWTGEPQQGKTLSQCPPDYLDMLAARYDYFNTKETDEKKRGYNARDAARCRGWAARLRSGWTPPKAASDWDESEKPQW